MTGKELLFLGRESKRWTADRVREALGGRLAAQARFETGLDHSGAIRELLRPGTLVVLPTLLENSPYSVAECLEHGIPFVASRVGGLPELVSEADADRVLTEPTAAAFSQAIARALSDRIAPARPANTPDAAKEAWLRIVDELEPTPSDDQRFDGDEDWHLVTADDVVPDDGLLDALRHAQAASGADVVTTGVRLAHDPETERMFLGDPGALGLVENHYGVVGLVRRALHSNTETRWPLFARLALGGARVVSVRTRSRRIPAESRRRPTCPATGWRCSSSSSSMRRSYTICRS